MPSERTRALMAAAEFLRELRSGTDTPDAIPGYLTWPCWSATYNSNWCFAPPVSPPCAGRINAFQARPSCRVFFRLLTRLSVMKGSPQKTENKAR